jgi:LytS/YehU family sensor histidine kinase
LNGLRRDHPDRTEIHSELWRLVVPDGTQWTNRKTSGRKNSSNGRIVDVRNPQFILRLLSKFLIHSFVSEMRPITEHHPLNPPAVTRAKSALEASTEDRKAELRGLQAKLNPHFLFNLLNVIRALVHVDPKRADQAITSLAGILRNSLRTTETSLISLREELEQIHALLHLAGLRFGPRLESCIRVPDELLDAPVPPMLVLNLVENAITHGIGNLEQGGLISVIATASGDRIRISVRNPGRLDESIERGHGTRDALQRLEILFGGTAGFSLTQLDCGTVSADVTLPFSLPNFP